MTAALAPAPVMPPFNYSALPAEDRGWLRGQTGAIHALSRRIGGDLIQLGVVLTEIKARLGHGHWMGWCEAELPWAQSHTCRLLQVAAAFRGYISQAERFEPTALYALAVPTVPVSAREYAVQLAADGERVTAAVARDILDAYKPVADPDRAEARELAPDSDRDREKRQAEAAPGPHPGWDAMAELLAASSLLHVSKSDGDGPTDSVTVYSDAHDGPGPRKACGPDLETALLALAGRTREKPCPKCGKPKPLGQFGRNQTQPDGHNRRCKACERVRLRPLKARKRKAAEAVPAA